MTKVTIQAKTTINGKDHDKSESVDRPDTLAEAVEVFGGEREVLIMALKTWAIDVQAKLRRELEQEHGEAKVSKRRGRDLFAGIK